MSLTLFSSQHLSDFKINLNAYRSYTTLLVAVWRGRQTAHRNLPLSIDRANSSSDACEPTNMSIGIRGPYDTMCR